jgi:hypothetical protein
MDHPYRSISKPDDDSPAADASPLEYLPSTILFKIDKIEVEIDSLSGEKQIRVILRQDSKPNKRLWVSLYAYIPYSETALKVLSNSIESKTVVARLAGE